MAKTDIRGVAAGLCLMFAAACQVAAGSTEQQAPSGRAMTPEDLLAIQSIDDVAVSPDGAWVAVTVTRPRRAGEFYRSSLDSVQRADVWVASSTDGPAANITHGERDAAGYWSASWSPDGRYLAMLSTQGRDNVRLYVWERATRQPRRLTEEGVDLEALFYMPGIAEPGLVGWRDTNTLLAVLLPSGHAPLRFNEVERTTVVDSQSAAAVLRGRGPTAIAWSSGDPATSVESPVRGTLVSIDVRSGRKQLLAELPIAETRVAHRMITVSPNGRVAAISVPGEPEPSSPNAVLRMERYYPRRLGLVSIDATRDVRCVPDVQPVTFDTGNSRGALQWNAGSDSLALIGIEPGGDSAIPKLFIVDPGSHVVRRIVEPRDPQGLTLKFSDLRWNADDELLVAARPHSVPNEVISNDPINRQHDRPLGAPPATNWWLIDSRGGLSRYDFSPQTDPLRGQWQDAISKLSAVSSLHFSRTGDTFVYVTRDTRVYAMSRGRPNAVELLSLNRGLDTIERPRHLAFEYETADGQTLTATVLLPRGHAAGKRYPLIADVYGGNCPNAVGLGDRDERYQDYYLNTLLLAGRGYAVLSPCIPLAPMGAASDPLLDLGKGVEPAIAKAIELGLAHENRIGVLGVSYGAYTAVGLVARSARFRAAVALEGAYDLISLYGRTDRRYLYRPDAYASRGPYGAESYQMRMGVPLWRDVERYWRNSPLAHVEGIQTPLLLIHGTVDNLPVSQSEELFASLNRLGKRVEFVRYVGEEHAIESPENIRDMWQRILGWFERYL